MTRRFIVCISLCIATASSFGQDQNSKPADSERRIEGVTDVERRDVENAEARQRATQSPTQSSSPKPRESFVPSEEISEDLSVSFPVDI